MDMIAKTELAKAIMDTRRIYEASFEQDDRHDCDVHCRDLTKAAQKAGVDSDLQDLVAAMVACDFSDFSLWAEAILASETVAS